jgi:quercetin dioxygenase-like cupin family protein
MEIFEDLLELNQKIHHAEKDRNAGFFEKVLTHDFIFRGPGGKFDDKQSYLEGLAETTYDILEISNVEPILLTKDSGYVTCKITANGRRPDGTHFEGSFLESRFLRRKGSSWLMFAWYSLRSTAAEVKNEKYFTGDVEAQTLSEQPDKKVYQVFFHPSARTYWHIHTGLQKLFVISGSAYVVTRTEDGEQRTVLKNGDNIKIPPGVLHWHGATPETFMVHVASNMYNGYTNTYWFHPVTDDEYRYERKKRSFRHSELSI